MPREKPQPRLTRKHLARAQRERLVSRIALVSVGLIFAAVVVVIGYGIYEQQVLTPNRPAAVVNGDKISRDQLGARTAMLQSDLVQQRQQAQSMLAIFAGSQFEQQLQQQISQIDAQLNSPNYLAAQALQALINARLIQREAERRGLTVTDADVERAIQEAFGYFADGTPTPAPTPTIDAKLTAQVTPTTTPTAGPTETSTPTLAMSPTPAVTSTPTAASTTSPSPTPPPTATPVTRAAFDTAWKQYLDQMKSSLGVGEADIRERFAESLYRERLRQAIGADVPREQEQVWAKHILVADQNAALVLLDRLHKGESWDALAAAYSTDTSNKDRGGDLGWFGRGAMLPEFETAAFAGKVGEIVGPVQTSFGWHLILIVDHAMRRLDEAGYQAAVDKAFNEWLASALAKADLKFDPALVPPTGTPTATGEAAGTGEATATGQASTPVPPEPSATP
jgi:parvulin-like peptidyl-prolyl isomerase